MGTGAEGPWGACVGHPRAWAPGIPGQGAEAEPAGGMGNAALCPPCRVDRGSGAHVRGADEAADGDASEGPGAQVGVGGRGTRLLLMTFSLQGAGCPAARPALCAHGRAPRGHAWAGGAWPRAAGGAALRAEASQRGCRRWACRL